MLPPPRKVPFHENIPDVQLSHDPSRIVQLAQGKQDVPEDPHGDSGRRYRTAPSGAGASLLPAQIPEGMLRAAGPGTLLHQRPQREARLCGHAVHFQKDTERSLPFRAVRQAERADIQGLFFRYDAPDTAAKLPIYLLFPLCLMAQPDIEPAPPHLLCGVLLPAIQHRRTVMPHPMAREELLHHDDPAGIPVECFVEQGVPVFCKG